MELKDMIRKRKSVRSYTGQPVDAAALEQLHSFATDMKPLYPHIKYRWEIVSRQQVKCLLPWTTPQLIAVFSEETEGYLENVGFLFQQMDLYLQSVGLGVCWLGMGRMDERNAVAVKDDGMKFVMLLAFGHPKGEALRTDLSQFKRKAPAQIADREDPRLEPARLAPSSVNSQPWYFTHGENAIHVYCKQQKLFKAAGMSYMNRIDVGIALAHLYVADPASFRFCRTDAPALPGHGYIGSITL